MTSFKSQARKKISENIKHRTHRIEINTENDENLEDVVGSGQFGYRITPKKETGQKNKVVDKKNDNQEQKATEEESQVDNKSHKEDSDRIQGEFDEEAGMFRPEDSKTKAGAKKSKPDDLNKEFETNKEEFDKGKEGRGEGIEQTERDSKDSSETEEEKVGSQKYKKDVSKEKPYNEGVIDMKEGKDYEKINQLAIETKEEQEKNGSEQGGKGYEVAENSLENLRKEMEESFEKYKDQEGQVEKMRQDMSKFSRASSFLGIGKNKEGSISKDYRDKKADREEFKKEYRKNLQAYYNELVRLKKEDFSKEGLEKNSSGFRDKLRSFVLTETVIEGNSENKKEGSEEQTASERFTMLGYINKKEQEVLQARKEMMDQKKKNALNKLWDWYRKLPKEKRIAYGAAMSASLGGLAGLATGLGFSAALGYGAWRGVKSAGRRTAFAGVGAGMAKGADKIIGSRHKKKNETDRKRTYNEIVKGFSEGRGELFELLDNYNKKEKRRAISKAAVVSFASGGLMAGAIGLDNFFPADDGVADIKNDKMERAVVNATDEDYQRESAPTENGHSRTVKQDIVSHTRQAAPGVAESIDHSEKFEDDTSELLEKFNNQFKSDMESFSEVNQNDINRVPEQQWEDEKISETDNEENTEAGTEILADYSLQKGDTVWGKLEEYYDGNQNKVGNEILRFKKDLAENLMENGLFENKEQAENYMTWRFRHMEVGMKVNITENGLDIPGFSDDEHINRFKEQELGISRESSSPADSNNPENVNSDKQEESSSESKSQEVGGADKEMTEAVQPSETLVKGLEDVGVEVDSEAWEIAQGLTVEDLLENFPPNAGITEVQSNMPPGASLEEAEKMREISRTVDSYTPSMTDQTLMVEKFLEDNAE